MGGSGRVVATDEDPQPAVGAKNDVGIAQARPAAQDRARAEQPSIRADPDLPELQFGSVPAQRDDVQDAVGRPYETGFEVGRAGSLPRASPGSGRASCGDADDDERR